MAGQIECPRCGARDSFIKGYLPETCVCRVCQSQLDWREIPGCGPDCGAVAGATGERSEGASGGGTATQSNDSADDGGEDV